MNPISPEIDQTFSTLVSEWMERGGPVMWPLLLCSVIAVAVVVERAIIFLLCSRRASRGEQALETAYALLQDGKTEEAAETAKSAGPIGEVLSTALTMKNMSLEDALETAGGQFLSNLRRHMPLLDTIITLAPMLGILGTVTGIIGSFRLLDMAGGTDPAAISTGIAEALITTASGLTIAIAALVPFNFFKTRLADWAKQIDRAARRCLTAYQKGKPHAV